MHNFSKLSYLTNHNGGKIKNDLLKPIDPATKAKSCDFNFDNTVQQELETTNLMNSIKRVKRNYEKEKLKKVSDSQLAVFQWNFWKSNVLDVNKEIKLVLKYLKKKKKINLIKLCKKEFIDFCVVIGLFEKNIINDLNRRDFPSCELTIFIGIHQIQKYRCKTLIVTLSALNEKNTGKTVLSKGIAHKKCNGSSLKNIYSRNAQTNHSDINHKTNRIKTSNLNAASEFLPAASSTKFF